MILCGGSLMPWVYCPQCGNPLTFTMPAPDEYEIGFAGSFTAPVHADVTVKCETVLRGTWSEERRHAKQFGLPTEIELTGRQIDTMSAGGKWVKEDEVAWRCGWNGTLDKITVLDNRTECHCLVNGNPVVLLAG